jgi:hypothetical protein
MSNVKPGDLARVVAPFQMCGRGAIVKVIRASGRAEWLSGTYYEDNGNGESWVCEGYVRWGDGTREGPLVAIYDECLRRIDPGEREDEMLLVIQRKHPNPETA